MKINVEKFNEDILDHINNSYNVLIDSMFFLFYIMSDQQLIDCKSKCSDRINQDDDPYIYEEILTMIEKLLELKQGNNDEK